MTPSRNCIDLIKQFEGFKLAAYPDPATGAEPWTIGYGSTGPDITRHTIWNKTQADARLLSDVGRFAAGVAKIAGPCSQGQFDALVSFAYNCGLTNLKTSTLLKLHLAGDHAGAQAQFTRWNKAAGKVLAGLTKRRAAEAVLYGR